MHVCSVSCRGVANMLLVLSITFYFHYNIWGCMCSTGDWMDISIAHAVIIIKSEVSTPPTVTIFIRSCLPEMFIILSLIAYTFRENREFVFIIIVQFMKSANSRIRLGLRVVFVCLYNTPFHHHHCANSSADIELIKCLSDTFFQCVSMIKHILSVILYTKCGTVFSIYSFPLW